MIFSKRHLVFLSFIVLMLFVIMTANFCPYHVPNGQVFFPIAFVVLLFSFYHDLFDYNKTFDVFFYFIVSLFVFCSHFFLSFQIPNIRSLIEIFAVCSFLYLKPEARLWVYDKFIRVFSVLLFFSIIEYLLIYVGVSFFIGQTIRPQLGYHYYQGLLNMVPYYHDSFFRFHFITEEPGFIGTTCFLLIATLDKKKYKKEYIVFIVAGIISFSLAFYLLSLLWCVSKIKPSNFKFLLIPLVLYAAFSGPINEKIIDRVVDKSADGTLDNRNSWMVLRLYDEMWQDGRIVLGIGNRVFYGQDLGASSGVKRFIIQYGLVGVLLIFASFSWIFFRYNKFNYSNAVILILFWISFYQRSDLNIEINFVILYSYGLVGEKRFCNQFKQCNLIGVYDS